MARWPKKTFDWLDPDDPSMMGVDPRDGQQIRPMPGSVFLTPDEAWDFAQPSICNKAGRIVSGKLSLEEADKELEQLRNKKVINLNVKKAKEELRNRIGRT